MRKLILKIKRVIIVLFNLKILQVIYLIRKKTFLYNKKTLLNQKFKKFKFIHHTDIEKCYYKENNSFLFLNKHVKFGNSINWNFSKNGLLWTYNLCYFDFINQKDLNNKKKNDLINSFYSDYNINHPMSDPYPTSLRIINLIKLIGSENIFFENKKLLKCVHNDAQILISRLEYHLLGNHLLENAIALFFVSFLVDDNKVINASYKIFKSELKEQILSDGAHFELSTMYHHILLKKLIELKMICHYNKCNENKKFLDIIDPVILKMISWANNININKNYPPLINDSAFNNFLNFNQINKLIKKLNLPIKKNSLTKSGFRVLNSDKLQILADVSNILSSYQPGHSHSDSLNFLLYFNKNPIIIDPGISTYENNNTRIKERSILYHNTVSINKENSSDIWGSFRVSKMALTKIIVDKKKELIATHNGYKNKYKAIHYRRWLSINKGFIIEDKIISNNRNYISELYLHFDYKNNLIKNKNYIICDDIRISFEGAQTIKLKKYNQPNGYNNFVVSNKIIVTFSNKIITKIYYSD